MFPVKDSFNIVLNGAWNPSIFSQTWILNNIVDSDENVEISIAFPIDDPTAPRKISFEGLNIYPGRKQLLLSAESSNLNGIRLCAKKLMRILGLLVHTPVGSCGINFHFQESNNLERVQNILNFNDQKAIDSKKYTLISSNVTRKFRVQEEYEINLSISDAPNGIILGFNFHYDLNDINAIRDLITEDYVETIYNQAIVFCKENYDLAIEEGEDNDE